MCQDLLLILILPSYVLQLLHFLSASPRITNYKRPLLSYIALSAVCTFIVGSHASWLCRSRLMRNAAFVWIVPGLVLLCALMTSSATTASNSSIWRTVFGLSFHRSKPSDSCRSLPIVDEQMIDYTCLCSNKPMARAFTLSL